MYQQVKRLREGERGFCESNCRKEFHKHGGAFVKLKPVIRDEVRKQVRQLNPVDAAFVEEIRSRLAALEDANKRMAEAFNFRRTA